MLRPARNYRKWREVRAKAKVLRGGHKHHRDVRWHRPQPGLALGYVQIDEIIRFDPEVI